MNTPSYKTKTVTFIRLLLLAGVCLTVISCATKTQQTESAFIDTMVTKHRFNGAELNELFESVEIKDDILKKMAAPAEGLPWYKYRKIFITEARINGGVKFWHENRLALAAAEQQYGVPAEIIVAILGVETNYGQNTGKHRVIDALATLGFAYPPRSQFFLGELENFLLLCREQSMNPLEPTGSYAGAMGMPQFMPSSFRVYAADYDNDGRRDIWHNNGDVIASVANYFVRHGWRAGQPIALPVDFISGTASRDAYQSVLNNADLKPDLRVGELESLNLKLSSRPLPLDTKVKLLAFEQQSYGQGGVGQQPDGQTGNEELWAALDNFYCITRYNHSPLYAMAVYQLSLSILNKKGTFP